MKLKNLREHYSSSDGGKTWRPKRSFNSEDDAKQNGFYPGSWLVYQCGICNFFHVSDTGKGTPK